MHTLSVVVLLVALTTGSHAYGYGGRHLLQGSRARASGGASSSGDGHASASGHVTSTGGSASIRVTADSSAQAEAQSALVKYLVSVHNNIKFPVYKGGPKGQYCLNAYGIISDKVIAYGRASASAYASTSVEASVTGSGSACGDANASARSQAAAYAKLVARAVARASIGKYRSKSQLSANIVSGILVQAFAEAWSSACAHDNSFASTYQTSHAQSIGYPIAALTIWLFAEVDCRNLSDFAEVAGSGESYVQSESSAGISTDTETTGGATATSGGDAGAAATQRCRGLIQNVCCRSYRNRDFCDCRRFGRRRCDAEREHGFSRLTWFDNRTQKSCHC